MQPSPPRRSGFPSAASSRYVATGRPVGQVLVERPASASRPRRSRHSCARPKPSGSSRIRARVRGTVRPAPLQIRRQQLLGRLGLGRRRLPLDLTGVRSKVKDHLQQQLQGATFQPRGSRSFFSAAGREGDRRSARGETVLLLQPGGWIVVVGPVAATVVLAERMVRAARRPSTSASRSRPSSSSTKRITGLQLGTRIFGDRCGSALTPFERSFCTCSGPPSRTLSSKEPALHRSAAFALEELHADSLDWSAGCSRHSAARVLLGLLHRLLGPGRPFVHMSSKLRRPRLQHVSRSSGPRRLVAVRSGRRPASAPVRMDYDITIRSIHAAAHQALALHRRGHEH